MPSSQEYRLVCPYCGGSILIGDGVVTCIEPGTCTWYQEEE